MSENKSRKLYYSMGEVSEMFDLNTTTVRFWANTFDIIKPHRNKKGNRMFTPNDIENFKLIYHLVKERGMTLDGAKKALKGNRDEILRKAEIVERLQIVRSLLMEIKLEIGDDSTYQIIENETVEVIPASTQEELQEEIEIPQEITEETTTEQEVIAKEDVIVEKEIQEVVAEEELIADPELEEESEIEAEAEIEFEEDPTTEEHEDEKPASEEESITEEPATEEPATEEPATEERQLVYETPKIPIEQTLF